MTTTPDQDIGHGPTPEKQLECLRNAALVINKAIPEAGSFDLETSDQSRHGFVLRDITTRTGNRLGETDPELLQQLTDQLYDYLGDLDWDSVVGEDDTGHVTLPAIPDLLPVDAGRTFILVQLGFQIHDTGLTQKDVDRAHVRVRSALQRQPGVVVLDVHKDRDSFRIQHLGIRRDPVALARQTWVIVSTALRELGPHTTLGVHVTRTAPGAGRHSYRRALATARQYPISVSLG